MALLTKAGITAAKPRDKAYKLSDERGLCLIVNPNGGRWWRLRYRYGGREKMLSLGTYPDVTLKRAREKRDEARRLVADGIDPSAKKKAEVAARADTFEAITREWLALQAAKVETSTLTKDRRRLELHIFPELGSHPIASITGPDLLSALRKVKAADTAHRTKQVCGRVFRYAVATGRAKSNPAADITDALEPVVTKPFAAITEPKRIGELLRSIDGYSGQPSTVAALKLAPLLFVRPGELRKAEWSEFDLQRAEWRIPAARMKMRDAHLVPLAKQALVILRDLHRLTGRGSLVFPGLRPKRPISENTLNAALRTLGFAGDEMQAHGFRSMASTRLNEMGFPPDVIELQLAHKERNKVRAAYNRAERLAERRRMMQTWADYLDGLRAGAKVTPIRAGRLR